MTKDEFKIGDKVRMVRTVCFDYETYLQGSIGYVAEIGRPGFVRLKMINSESGRYGYPYMCVGNVELVDK